MITLTDTKQRARQLLAAEYERVDPYTSKLLRDGAQVETPALRAIESALSERGEAKHSCRNCLGIAPETCIFASGEAASA